MAADTATLNSVRRHLADHPGKTVGFSTSQGIIPTGFHLTEFKRNRVDSVDCGGVQNQWEDASIELLGDLHGDPISTDKLLKITAITEKTLPGIGELPLYLDVALLGDTVRRYRVGVANVAEGKIVFDLLDTQGECKENTRALAEGRASCCAPTASPSGCCGSAGANSCC